MRSLKPSSRSDLTIDITDGEPVFESAELRRVEWLGKLLDSSIPVPGTTFTVGIDAVLGLFPGFGDAIGGLLSTFILYEAARLGAPVRVLSLMLVNIAIDSTVGLIPVLGDLFDMGWKANVRNVNLLRNHLAADPGARTRTPEEISWLIRVAVVILAGLIVASGIFVLSFMIRIVFG